MIGPFAPLKTAINGVLGLAGLRLARNDLHRLSQTDAALRQILQQLGISVVFDVGAHVGEYAMRLRELGYRGRIVSFEPQADAFTALARLATRDPRWDALPLGLA